MTENACLAGTYVLAQGLGAHFFRSDLQKSNDDYFKRQDECMNLLKVQKYPGAEESCKSAVAGVLFSDILSSAPEAVPHGRLN